MSFSFSTRCWRGPRRFGFSASLTRITGRARAGCSRYASVPLNWGGEAGAVAARPDPAGAFQQFKRIGEKVPVLGAGVGHIAVEHVGDRAAYGTEVGPGVEKRAQFIGQLAGRLHGVPFAGVPLSPVSFLSQQRTEQKRLSPRV